MGNLYEEIRHKVIGVLKISKVTWEDSGQYTCFQMSVKPDSAKLFVAESMLWKIPDASTANQKSNVRVINR